MVAGLLLLSACASTKHDSTTLCAPASAAGLITTVSPAGEELPGGTVQGIVKDTGIDEAMTKVRVELLRAESTEPQVRLTDSQGQFAFDSLPTGLATLEVSADGYTTYDTRLSVNPEHGHWIPVLLAPCR